MSRHSDNFEKYVLILSDIRGCPPRNITDYKPIKDLIRGLINEEPGWINIVGSDRATAMCDFKIWRKAFSAFKALNGYPWQGTHLDAILAYPDGTWLIHPRTNPTASKPLVRRYRTNSGLWYPVITPQLEGGRRNPSVSSMSSQASSQGGHTTPSSLGSIGSSGTHPQVFAAYDLVISVPAVVDTTSGAILPPDTASTHLAAPPLDDSSRYQIYLHISNTGAYSPQSPSHIAPRPRLEHRTERRTIIIRELNFDVTEQGLQGLLVAQNLAGLSSFYITRPENRRCHALVTFTTCPDAREAVRRLHNRRFMDRILKVDLAQEPSPVDVKRPIIADGSI